jgi:hypothetical protein
VAGDRDEVRAGREEVAGEGFVGGGPGYEAVGVGEGFEVGRCLGGVVVIGGDGGA